MSRAETLRGAGRCFIGGRWEAGANGRFAVLDPATDAPIAQVADASVEQMHAAIEAADGAWAQWRSQTAEARAVPLRALATSMRSQRERLAALLTAEQGKPLAEALGEIDYAAGFIAWAAEEGKRVYGESVPSSKPDKRIWVLRQPVGVVVAITPWNFPTAMITRKVGPALAAGCPVVIKPAEQTPLSALALAELAEDAGFPAGVFNVVTSSDPVAHGGAIMSDARVRKVTFTGSTEVGRWLVAHAAQHLPRLSLELGGHAPAIIFEDADLERAAREVVAAKFRNCGQTCVCVNRIFVQRSVEADFVEALSAVMGELRVGVGTDADVDIGPLIDDAALEKVEAHVRDALDGGAELVMGGHAPAKGEGRFYPPTLLTKVRADARVMREETFGPVAPVVTFDSESEAIALANDTPFGLAAYFFSRDAARCHRVAEALEYGIVGINDGRPSTVEAPFGGFKQSGWGREGGKYAMDAFLETKYVSWGL